MAKLTPEILKDFGLKYSKADDLWYNKDKYYENNYLKRVSVKRFLDDEIEEAYARGRKDAQYEVRRALGIRGQ